MRQKEKMSCCVFNEEENTMLPPQHAVGDVVRWKNIDYPTNTVIGIIDLLKYCLSLVFGQCLGIWTTHSTSLSKYCKPLHNLYFHFILSERFDLFLFPYYLLFRNHVEWISVIFQILQKLLWDIIYTQSRKKYFWGILQCYIKSINTALCR